MGKIHGIPVILYEKQKVGVDNFGIPIYEDTPVVVDNVLVGQPSAQEITDTLNLTGKQVVYVLGIPKGDTHTWTDRKIEFFGEKFRAIAVPIQGVDDMVPLSWNQQIRVERFG